MADPAAHARPRRPALVLLVRLAPGLGALLVAACLVSCAGSVPATLTSVGSGSAATAVPNPSSTGSHAGATSATTANIPAVDRAAIDAVLQDINATAGGAVAAQRAILQRWVVPDEAGAQRDCPAAHNTLRLDAVYDDLRLSPDASTGTSAGATSTGAKSTGAKSTTAKSTRSAAGPTEYLLPVLITIFTGARITGTDLTTLRLFVTKGTARIGHLCVS